MLVDHQKWCWIHKGDASGCTCGADWASSRNAIAWLVAVIRATVPLAAAAQAERERLLGGAERMGASLAPWLEHDEEDDGGSQAVRPVTTFSGFGDDPDIEDDRDPSPM